MMRATYIPIRVDVTSENDSKLRIIDTLLLDRNVLPLPLEPDRLEDSLAENALYMAKSILADAEVIGMGRTVRHFTGRMDLWSWDMIEKIQKCILDQLYAAFDESSSLSSSEPPPRKKAKANHANHVIEPQDKTEASEQTDTKEEDTKEESSSRLIPIRIRMELNGHRIHDDFYWDPSFGNSIDPLTLAKSIGNDLKLPPEAISELAINIAEQIMGMTVPEGGSPEDVTTATATPIGPVTTAAWTLEPRVHQNNLAHLALVMNVSKEE